MAAMGREPRQKNRSLWDVSLRVLCQKMEAAQATQLLGSHGAQTNIGQPLRRSRIRHHAARLQIRGRLE
jgi:hypothetical protein